MNLLERHLARVYAPDSPIWDDPAALARADDWTLALWDQLAPEDAGCDFYWLPPVPQVHRAWLAGQLRSRLLAALHRRRWAAAFTPKPWALRPASPGRRHHGPDLAMLAVDGAVSYAPGRAREPWHTQPSLRIALAFQPRAVGMSP